MMSSPHQRQCGERRRRPSAPRGGMQVLPFLDSSQPCPSSQLQHNRLHIADNFSFSTTHSLNVSMVCVNKTFEIGQKWIMLLDCVATLLEDVQFVEIFHACCFHF
jgi:hypothetical protein